MAVDVMGCMRAEARSNIPARITLDEESPGDHVLRLDGESEFRTDDLGKLVHQTMWEVTRRGVHSRTDALVLHAAAVMLHGTIVLISGRSGAGKSTLAAALLELGASYLTDEAVEIDATGQPVDWLVRPLKLDEHSLNSLDQVGGLTFTHSKGFVRSSGPVLPDGTVHVPVAAERLFDKRPTAGTMVVFLESQAGPLLPEPASRSTAVARLIGESFVPGSRRQSGLEAAASLSKGPRLLTMSGGSVQQRAEWIDAALR
ncbi:MAG: hypothetical protein QNM02_12490 [Acidimicrobiia bacterium]|nr:hypothetical protein [Acidimicrobiia bacterium]